MPLDIAFTSFTFNINNTINIGKKGWTGEWSGWYRYKTLENLNIVFPMGQMSFGLAKNNLMKGKASIRLNTRDPFGWQRFKATTKYGESVDLALNNRWDNRSFGASFTYRFGKTQVGQPRRRTSATAEEEQRVGGAGN